MDTILNWSKMQALPVRILVWLGIIVVILALAWVGRRINKMVFRHLQKKGQGIHLGFLERLNAALITIGAFVVIFAAMGGVDNLWRTLLGGTAIISAVLAFAAQDVLKDILAGLMLSVNKPFKIGDRIVMENGTFGIVESMTMRHVVLKGVDSLRLIVPNSKINAMTLENLSFGREDRCIQFTFPVGYNSDVELVRRVIAHAVEDSPYSVPPRLDNKGRPCYSPVRFMRLDDSALIMQVSVYFTHSVPPEVLTDDINTTVRAALLAAGVEIPYNYVNVVHINEGEGGKTAPGK